MLKNIFKTIGDFFKLVSKTKIFVENVRLDDLDGYFKMIDKKTSLVLEYENIFFEIKEPEDKKLMLLIKFDHNEENKLFCIKLKEFMDKNGYKYDSAVNTKSFLLALMIDRRLEDLKIIFREIYLDVINKSDDMIFSKLYVIE
jgi:hypothetical protein